MSTATEYLGDLAARFRDLKTQAERAAAQVSDDDFVRGIDDGSNSIAVLMRHLGGNMRSRWRDLLTTDGEKADRRRDQEFELPPGASRASVVAEWNAGWAMLFDQLGRLTESDLERTVTARHEPMSVVSAVNRQFGHTALHVGQIVMLAKHFAGDAWQTLSIARGGSDAFNARMREQFQR